MTAERSEPTTLRLFVALELPERVRDGIHTWGAMALEAESLRPVAPEALHVTLAFLGTTPAARADDAAAIVRSLERRAVPMRFRPDPVPVPRRRPRLFTLELESAAAAELHDALVPRLTAAGLYEPDQRPFWPHVTVARIRPQRRPARIPELPQRLLEPFGGVRVRLYRSLLRPDGAEYVSLASLDLPPVAAEPGAEER